jgi:hypothetical protein
VTHVLDSETGHFISAEHQRVAEVISSYDPTLQLLWIPPEKRDLDESFPYALLHTPTNGQAPYIVRKVREVDMNQGLIAWVFANDQVKNPNDLNEFQDIQEAARRALIAAEIAEARAEKYDFAQSVLNGPNYYRHGGRKYV